MDHTFYVTEKAVEMRLGNGRSQTCKVHNPKEVEPGKKELLRWKKRYLERQGISSER